MSQITEKQRERVLFQQDDKLFPEQFRSVDKITQDYESSANAMRFFKDLYLKDTAFVDNNEFWMARGQRFERTVVSGSVYSVLSFDYLMGVTWLGAAVTIGLPRPIFAKVGKTYVVKDEVGGAATTNVTVVSQAAETIDGAASAVINTNYGAKSFYTDGANWFTF